MARRRYGGCRAHPDRVVVRPGTRHGTRRAPASHRDADRLLLCRDPGRAHATSIRERRFVQGEPPPSIVKHSVCATRILAVEQKLHGDACADALVLAKFQTNVIATVLLTGAAFVASFIRARRATVIDPLVALRPSDNRPEPAYRLPAAEQRSDRREKDQSRPDPRPVPGVCFVLK